MDFRETGLHYLLHLARSRDDAYVNDTDDQVEAIDAQIREYLLFQAIPQRWQLGVLFSWDAYCKKFGGGLLSFWAISLIQIGVLVESWEDIVLGYKPRNPYLLPGFHAEEDVYSTDWLDDFRPGWSEELLAALPRTESVEEEVHAYRETEPELAAVDSADWVH